MLTNGVIRPVSALTLGTEAVIFEDGSTLQVDAPASMIVCTGDLTLENGSRLALDASLFNQSGDVVLATYAGALSGEFTSVTPLAPNWSLDYGAGNNSAITLVSPPKGTVMLIR